MSSRLAKLTADAAAHHAVAADARASRDAAWYAEYQAGRPVRAIAEESGAHPATVHRAIIRETSRHQAAASQ